MREGLTDKKKCPWNYNSKSLWVSSHWAHQRGPSDWYGIWKSQAICNSEVRDNGRTANKRVGWMWMFMHWAVGCVCQSLSHWAVRPSEKLQKCHAFIRQDRRLSLNGWLRGTRAGSLALLRGSSQPKDRSQVSGTAGKFFTSWATQEAQEYWSG